MFSNSRLFCLCLILLFTLLASEIVTAQPDEVKIIPPSPNVMAINKYVDVPVSHYTGTAQISVPLHSLEMQNISLPITLSYHSSGVKVDEIPSFVGAGWTLNATGVISRTMQGLPDEYVNVNGRYGFFSDKKAPAYNPDGSLNYTKIDDCTINSAQPEPFQTGDPVNFPDSVAAGLIDLQPDLFHYSLPGSASGKLVFDQRRNAVKLNADDVLISSTPFDNTVPQYDGPDYRWEIIDDTGVRYIFDKAEVSESYSACGAGDGNPPVVSPTVNYQSSWYLSKIIAYTDTIRFNYIQETIIYEQNITESAKFKVEVLLSGGDTGPESTRSNCRNYSQVEALRLSSIVTSNGDLIAFESLTPRTDLNGSKRLDGVRIYKGGSFVKGYKFEYGSFNDIKLKLDKVVQVSEDNTPLSPYSFEYYAGNIPALNSPAQDYWGYYNGASNNSILPKFKDANYLVNNPGANRNPVLEYCRIGALKAITYPTGGHTAFSYELNSYYDAAYPVTYVESLSLTGGTIENPIEDTKSFTVTQDCQVTIEKSTSDNIENYVELRDATLAEAVLSPTGNRYQLPAGTYWLYVKSGGTQENYIRVEYEQPEPRNVDLGGLRISSITSYDPATNAPPITKTFTYQNEDGTSSGALFTKPIHAYTSTYQFGELLYNSSNFIIGCQDRAKVRYVNLSAFSQLPLGYVQGSHVGYSRVVVKQPDGSGQNIGMTEYKFINDVLDYPVYPFVPAPDLSYKNGKLLEENYYVEGANTPISSKIYNYDTAIQEGSVIGVSLKLNNSAFCYSCDGEKFSYNTYNLKPTWHRLSTIRSINFNQDYSLQQSTWESYQYDTDHHKPVAIQSYGNDVTEVEEKIFLYYEYSGLIASIERFIDNNKVAGSNYTYHGKVPLTIEVWNNENQQYFKSVEHQFSNSKIISKIAYGDLNQLSDRQSFIYANQLNYVIASATNAEPAEIRHTSFEENSSGGWSFDSPGVVADTSTSKTGDYYYDLSAGDISTTITKTTNYTISLWTKGTGSVQVLLNGTPIALAGGQTSMGWTYYEGSISANENQVVTVSGDMNIDELRLYPENSEMTTYTYGKYKKISSVTDNNSVTTYYEYDEFGRLLVIYDHEKNIIKGFDYQFYKEQ